MITTSIFNDSLLGEIAEITITNKKGAYVTFFSLGATIKSIVVPDKNSKLTDVVLGYETPCEYIEKGGFYGVTVGRNANRIGGAKFNIDSKTYKVTENGNNMQLHGGKSGFDKKIWDYKIKDDNTVIFSLFSPDGEEGFPANLNVEVIYSWDENCELSIEYVAKADADTVVNMTNHSYFNLSGCKEDILNTTLQINADYYTVGDETVLPNGEIAKVENTPLDFRSPKKIGQDILNPSLLYGGYDHNFCLNERGFGFAAEAYCEKNGICMKTETNQVGVQLYTHNNDRNIIGKGGVLYNKFAGFCLETQFWPNSVNYSHFPSPILRKSDTYNVKTVYTFSIK